MVIASAEPPEAHVHGLENFVYHAIVGDADGSRVFALDGRVSLRPSHFYESVFKGYHGFGSYEEAQ